MVQHVSLKRKPDADDPDSAPPDSVVSADSLLVDTSSCGPSNAPRQSWIASDTGNDVWPPSSTSSPLDSNPAVLFPTHLAERLSPVSPSTPSPRPFSNRAKRPRLEKSHLSSPCPKRSPRRHPSNKASSASGSLSPTILRRSRRLGGDIQDTGIVSSTNPGPTSGSLLRLAKTLSGSHSSHYLSSSSSIPLVPIDPNSPHIPSSHPLINRQTLKELDLEAILRNPQLRTFKHFDVFRVEHTIALFS
jgi:hypothetical protein